VNTSLRHAEHLSQIKVSVGRQSSFILLSLTYQKVSIGNV
jgi:hypothetical protein